MLPEATSGPTGFVPRGTVGRKRPVLYGATYTQLNLGRGYFVSRKCYFVAVLGYLSKLCIWTMGIMCALFPMCLSDVQSLDWSSCGRADVDLRIQSC